MIAAVRMMLTCRWSARRIQRYIDADPAARLSADEVGRLESHLAVCERCTEAVRDYLGVKAALACLSDRRTPHAARVARLKLEARRLSSSEQH